MEMPLPTSRPDAAATPPAPAFSPVQTAAAPALAPASARAWKATTQNPAAKDAGIIAGLGCVGAAWLLLAGARFYRVPAPDTALPMLIAVAIACALGGRAGLSALGGTLAVYGWRLWPFLSVAGAARTAGAWRLGWFALGAIAIWGAFLLLRARESRIHAQAGALRRGLWDDLRATEDRETELRRALEGVADGVVICDPHGLITFANREARRLHAYDANANASDLARGCRYFSSDGRALMPSALPLSRALKGEAVENFEWRIRRDDGGEIVAQGAARPVRDLHGNTLGAILSLRDASAQKRALSDLERSNQIKTQFLGVLSHELRTPLTPILGWVTLLRGPNANLLKDADAVNGALEAIERNALSQKRLIDDLIDSISLLSGGLKLSPSPALLPGALRKGVEEMTPTASLRNITFKIECDEILPPLLLDEPRFAQALRHLLSNAVKFSSDNGVVRVCARYARDIALPGQDVPAGVALPGVVTVDVIDAGEGIPPEVLPWVFEMFRQGDGSATRRHGGLGVGLTLARALIELHEGDLSAHSDGENCGARFTIVLPVPA